MTIIKADIIWEEEVSQGVENDRIYYYMTFGNYLRF